MQFDKDYQDIKNIILDDLNRIETDIQHLFSNKTPLEVQLSEYLKAPSKRLRPVLSLLFIKNIYNEVSQKQKDVLVAVELIHNATLIHDDVIDNATTRRKNETLNAKFDNNLAVIAGDFLLSCAMEKIIDLNSQEVIKLCTSALKTTCLGEIHQYFGKFKIPSLDEYIRKSEEKTALLFEIGILSAILLQNPEDENLLSKATAFSKNFGIAFQIRDDLINILRSDSIQKNDFAEGIYTAPLIFAHQENPNIIKEENILMAIKQTQGIEKTKILMDNYFNSAISAIEDLENNTYKEGIIKLIEILKTDYK